tara:strand:+ start:541 stop:972 length:432 start_codon:yes stop_codon:yes gene_type:complete
VGHTKLFIAIGLSIVLASCNEEEPAKQIGSGPAQLVLALAELRYEVVDGRHTYFHKRKYTESIGTGVTLQAGKVCVENGKACLSARVNYRIDGGKDLVQPNHHVATRLAQDTITIKYWGKDDAGNDVRVDKTLTVEGEKIEVR